MKRHRQSGTGDGRGPQYGGGGGPQMNQLSTFADAVKAGQRSSQNFKNAWHQYCDTNGQQMYDPNKQNIEFIQGFMDQLGSAFLQVGGGGGGAASLPPVRGGWRDQQSAVSPGGPYNNGGGRNMNQRGRSNNMSGGGGNGSSLQKVIEMVKQGQRNSADWKAQWIDWCSENGNGVNDPNRHSAIFIIAFVLKFGLAEVVSASWAAPYLVCLGELAKPLMVDSIKRGQKNSDIWKEQWGLFADSKASNTRDPNRHDAGSLMEFFDTIAMQSFSHEPWMQPYVDGSEPEP